MKDFFILLVFILLFVQLSKIALLDIKYKKITNRDNIIVFTILIVILVLKGTSVPIIILKLLFSILFMIIFILISKKKIGGGDIKLLAALQLLIGIENMWLLLLLTSIFGIFHSKIIEKDTKKRSPIPLAPSIVFSMFLIVLVSNFI